MIFLFIFTESGFNEIMTVGNFQSFITVTNNPDFIKPVIPLFINFSLNKTHINVSYISRTI